MVADHVVQQSARMCPAWAVLVGAVEVHLIVLVPVIVIVTVVAVGFATLGHTPWYPCNLAV